MGRFEGTYLKLASYRDAYIAATQAVERAGSRVEAVKTRMMLGDKAAEGGWTRHRKSLQRRRKKLPVCIASGQLAWSRKPPEWVSSGKTAWEG